MSNILINNNFYIGTSSACITDLTPPTFSGIASLVVGSRGQLIATWLAASDITPPIRYEFYIKASTSVGLFNSVNLLVSTEQLTFSTFTMPDNTFLVNGTTYYVGIRAVDAVGNRDSNTVSLSVLSTGVFVSNEDYEVSGAFAVNSSNQLQGTLWALKNTVIATSSNATMGTASYQVYDKNGNAIVGLSGTGITANSQGQYVITPVASSLNQSLDHYVVKISISVDGAIRDGYVSLIQKVPQYDISGMFFINNANNFDGSFWVSADEQIRTTGLGTASYQVFDQDGNIVVGMSASGISADVNGVYKITSIPSLLGSDIGGYSVKVTINIDSVNRSEMLGIQSKIIEYQPKAQFSINALNQFQGTLWLAKENATIETAALGTANYTVYDSSGVAVVGLTQSGITADVNGRFAITPVSASLLTDLTHYSVKIGIVANGIERIAYKGFTLLGT